MSWFSTIGDLPLWKSLTLLLPPSLALTYAISAASFVASWRETAWSTHLPSSLVPRLSLLAALVAVAASLGTSNDEDQLGYWAVMVCLGLVASVYLIRQTRIYVAEGGPAPILSDMKGKVVVITGANTGIGKATARQLAAKGATVVMACRRLDKAEAAKKDIVASLSSSNESQLDVVAMDLSRLSSVKEAASAIAKKYPKVDVLIANAGVMMSSQVFTDDGYELVMQANHLGHYLLTRLLMDNIKKAEGRILVVTSSTYSFSEKIDLADLFCKNGRKFSLFGQYSQSKLANILFVNELQKRYPSIFSAAVHPGLVRTDVVRNMSWYLRYPNIMFASILQTLQKDPEQGAWCTSYLATAPLDTVKSGQYWVNREIQDVWPCADDASGATELWIDSAKYVGLDQ